MQYFYLWLVILIVAIVVEVATAESLVSIWFALGCIIAMILNCFNLSITFQIAAFFGVSLLSLLAIRPLASRYFRGNIIATNADRLIHSRVRLIKEIKEDSYGEIKVNGIVWNAISADGQAISQGSKVEVMAIDGSKLVVRTIKEGD